MGEMSPVDLLRVDIVRDFRSLESDISTVREGRRLNTPSAKLIKRIQKQNLKHSRLSPMRVRRTVGDYVKLKGSKKVSQELDSIAGSTLKTQKFIEKSVKDDKVEFVKEEIEAVIYDLEHRLQALEALLDRVSSTWDGNDMESQLHQRAADIRGQINNLKAEQHAMEQLYVDSAELKSMLERHQSPEQNLAAIHNGLEEIGRTDADYVDVINEQITYIEEFTHPWKTDLENLSVAVMKVDLTDKDAEKIQQVINNIQDVLEQASELRGGLAVLRQSRPHAILKGAQRSAGNLPDQLADALVEGNYDQAGQTLDRLREQQASLLTLQMAKVDQRELLATLTMVEETIAQATDMFVSRIEEDIQGLHEQIEEIQTSVRADITDGRIDQADALSLRFAQQIRGIARMRPHVSPTAQQHLEEVEEAVEALRTEIYEARTQAKFRDAVTLVITLEHQAQEEIDAGDFDDAEATVNEYKEALSNAKTLQQWKPERLEQVSELDQKLDHLLRELSQHRTKQAQDIVRDQMNAIESRVDSCLILGDIDGAESALAELKNVAKQIEQAPQMSFDAKSALDSTLSDLKKSLAARIAWINKAPADQRTALVQAYTAIQYAQNLTDGLSQEEVDSTYNGNRYRMFGPDQEMGRNLREYANVIAQHFTQHFEVEHLDRLIQANIRGPAAFEWVGHELMVPPSALALLDQNAGFRALVAAEKINASSELVPAAREAQKRLEKIQGGEQGNDWTWMQQDEVLAEVELLQGVLTKYLLVTYGQNAVDAVGDYLRGSSREVRDIHGDTVKLEDDSAFVALATSKRRMEMVSHIEIAETEFQRMYETITKQETLMESVLWFVTGIESNQWSLDLSTRIELEQTRDELDTYLYSVYGEDLASVQEARDLGHPTYVNALGETVPTPADRMLDARTKVHSVLGLHERGFTDTDTQAA